VVRLIGSLLFLIILVLEKMYSEPLAYFITFSTYGTRLHGDERNSVVVQEKTPKLLSRNDAFWKYQSKSMKYPVVTLDDSQRQIVLSTILKHCEIKNWQLIAVHVRSNHVHILLKTNEAQDRVMTALKAWSTRKLREAGHVFERVWTKHGSTKYIFKLKKLREKKHYIIHEQGEMMSHFVDEDMF
jgi:REP element-mobilizing transposase RayT